METSLLVADDDMIFNSGAVMVNMEDPISSQTFEGTEQEEEYFCGGIFFKA